MVIIIGKRDSVTKKVNKFSTKNVNEVNSAIKRIYKLSAPIDFRHYNHAIFQSIWNSFVRQLHFYLLFIRAALHIGRNDRHDRHNEFFS